MPFLQLTDRSHPPRLNFRVAQADVRIQAAAGSSDSIRRDRVRFLQPIFLPVIGNANLDLFV